LEEQRPKKLLDQVRDAIRLKHYSLRTEQAYVGWNKRYICFHEVRHQSEMGAPEVEAFLTYLAVKENIAASTQNQTLSALLFLYREVLHQDLGPMGAGWGKAEIVPADKGISRDCHLSWPRILIRSGRVTHRVILWSNHCLQL